MPAGPCTGLTATSGKVYDGWKSIACCIETRLPVHVPASILLRSRSRRANRAHCKVLFSVPGDKSISHRALILGALAEGRTEISGLLESEDILCTAHALQQLGADMRKTDGTWTVTGCGPWRADAAGRALDFGNSGTGARLMMGVVAGHPIRAVFTGDESLDKAADGHAFSIR